ncbi:hypothetical protein [Streptomyces sp. AK02-04a]|uniref:hypothetical protein n=1 Tax=Streptomyces sp. AK02-04a TaxID=3028649 RepID=UPI0029BC572F|nr:hypothetical protein [Streptomyces sp. AK02-04a]MDX3757994.1 hypothetical protein [Streptomyces sp. AK02-04a]
MVELTRPAEGGELGAGAEFTRTAFFLTRRIDYVLRVAAYEPLRLLDMASVGGPLPMHVTYVFAPHSRGTPARIRVHGGPGGLYRVVAPLLASPARSTSPRTCMTSNASPSVKEACDGV